MMSNLPQHDSALSIHRAFVIYLQAEADGGHGCLAGRVEHAASGQVRRFHSLDELLAFIDQMMTQVPHSS